MTYQKRFFCLYVLVTELMPWLRSEYRFADGPVNNWRLVAATLIGLEPNARSTRPEPRGL
jgi:hypothetical protein